MSNLLKEDAFDGGAAVTTALQTTSAAPTPVHLLIHNTGGYGTPEDFTTIPEFVGSQTLADITPYRMMYAFQLNSMPPLFLTKALQPNLQAAVNNDSETTVKVVVITSLMGSLSDNTSGGIYAYRAAKASVNMIGKSMSHDLPKALGKDKDTPAKVAVGLVHPGSVFTDFAPNEQPLPGQRSVDVSVQGIIQAMDQHVTVESSGKFWHGNYGEGVKECQW